MLPLNQVIKQTINKEQKDPGGIIGMATSVDCVQRWVFSSHAIAEWSHDFKRSIGIDESESKPKDAGTKRMISDEKMVTSCYEVINHWQNPFIFQDKLIALSSGTVVGDDIIDEITNAEAIRKTSLKQFIDDRIINGTTEFHEKKQLKTFDSIGKKKVYKVKDELIPVKADRDTFGRMLVIQRIRGIDLQDVLEYELSSQPLYYQNLMVK